MDRTCGICIFSIFNSCVCIILSCKQNFPKCAEHSIIHSLRWRMCMSVHNRWACFYAAFHVNAMSLKCIRSLDSFFLHPYSSFHFQVPYPMFSAIYGIQNSHIYCAVRPLRAEADGGTGWWWYGMQTQIQHTSDETVNWQPLFILFTSKINLTPAQHNILDTYKMQIHLLFECGEDCFTSPVDTRFHVPCSLCGFHPVGLFDDDIVEPILPLHLTHSLLLFSCMCSYIVCSFSCSLFPLALFVIRSTIHSPSIHHMCISKPNYAMYKRSSSGKYYSIHLSILCHPFHFDSNFLPWLRPSQIFGFLYTRRETISIHCKWIHIHHHTRAPTTKHILHNPAIIIHFVPHSMRSIQQDHVSTHITIPDYTFRASFSDIQPGRCKLLDSILNSRLSLFSPVLTPSLRYRYINAFQEHIRSFFGCVCKLIHNEFYRSNSYDRQIIPVLQCGEQKHAIKIKCVCWNDSEHDMYSGAIFLSLCRLECGLEWVYDRRFHSTSNHPSFCMHEFVCLDIALISLFMKFNTIFAACFKLMWMRLLFHVVCFSTENYTLRMFCACQMLFTRKKAY